MRSHRPHVRIICLAVAFVCLLHTSGAQQPKVEEPIRDYFKFDEIPAYFPWTDVMARLDNVAIRFQKLPADQNLYLIAYAGPRACMGYADRLDLRAKTYLVTRRAVSSTRVVLMDGGYLAKPRLDVWMLPSPLLPSAMPNIDVKLLHVRHCAKSTAKRRRA